MKKSRKEDMGGYLLQDTLDQILPSYIYILILKNRTPFAKFKWRNHICKQWPEN